MREDAYNPIKNIQSWFNFNGKFFIKHIYSIHDLVVQTTIFFSLGFTPCKAEQQLRGMELQEKEAQKD